MKIFFVLLFSFNIFAINCNESYTPQPRKFVEQQNISLNLSSNIYKQSNFLFFDKSGEYGKYVTLNIPYEPVLDIFKQLKKFHPTLNNRGEAHITVITPVEYQCFFNKHGISINQIKEVVEDWNQSSFKVLSIGNGYKDLDDTFFIIVDSADLIALRKKLLTLLPENARFDPVKFYPHITVGFTSRDFHESDGVFKNEKFSKDSRFNLIVK
ncbi:2'-5' RNA ligase family protein [Halobacteriovorax sp. HLS]|uniref:2'-5' RNA ligase family protein n=1 Tax=Halobacteriovorax sp. HLS TaxID=2234000 RepID=UPI000FD8EB93|nr:2'-5' RNA ligase family protein [Halobacteriovorax sp. HLS]